MEIDFSKWIENYNPDDPNFSDNQNINVGNIYSDSLYNIYKNGLQSPGAIDSSPVYAVAGEKTRFANSLYNVRLTSNGNTGFSNDNPQLFELEITKLPPVQGNLYLHSFNPWAASFSSMLEGFAKWDADGVNKWMEFIETDSSGSFTSFPHYTDDAVALSFDDTLSGFLDGRHFFQTVVLYVTVSLVTMNAPGKFFNRNGQVFQVSNVSYDSFLETQSDTLIKNGYEFVTANDQECIRFVRGVYVNVYQKAQTNYVRRYTVPFMATNIDGVQSLLRPASEAANNRTVVIGGRGYTQTDGISNMELYGVTNFSNQPTSYGAGSGFSMLPELTTTEQGTSLHLLNNSTAYIPALQVDRITFAFTREMYDSIPTSGCACCYADDNNSPNIILVSTYFQMPVSSRYGFNIYTIWNRERIENFVSSYGLYWTGTLPYTILNDVGGLISDFITDSRVRLGHIDEQGITDGTYTQGTANTDGIQNEWVTPSDSPVAPIDPNISPEIISDLNGDSIAIGSALLLPETRGFTTFLALSSANLAALRTSLAATASDFWDAISIAGDKNSAAIINYIKSLRCYPFDIVTTLPSGLVDSVSAINFGYRNALLSVTCSRIACSAYEGNCGGIYIPPMFGQKTFLDYSPYATVTLSLPFVGEISLPPEFVINYTTQLKYIIDFQVGSVTFMAYSNVGGVQTPLVNVSATIAAEMPIVGNDITAQADKLKSAYFRAATHQLSNANMLMNSTNEVSAGATMIQSGVEFQDDLYSITSSKREIIRCNGGGSGFGNNMEFKRPFISVSRPRLHIPSTYSHDTGHACNYSAKLSTLAGFTVCQNPDLTGIPAQSDELAEIKNLLESGVYL